MTYQNLKLKRSRFELEEENSSDQNEHFGQLSAVSEEQQLSQKFKQLSEFQQPDLSNQRLKTMVGFGEPAVGAPGRKISLSSQQLTTATDPSITQKLKRKKNFIKLTRSTTDSQCPTQVTIEQSSTQSDQMMGLQKRRLIDQFEQLTLSANSVSSIQNNQPTYNEDSQNKLSFSHSSYLTGPCSHEQTKNLKQLPQKPKLIQVLKSETFGDQDGDDKSSSGFSSDCQMNETNNDSETYSAGLIYNQTKDRVNIHQSRFTPSASMSHGSCSISGSRNLDISNERQASDQSSNDSSLERKNAEEGLIRFKLADDQMSSQLKTMTRDSFIGGSSDSYSNNFAQNVRSRSWDGRSSSYQNSPEVSQNQQIELRSRLQNSQADQLTSFFKYYLRQVMTQNEQLNLSYLEKLKAKYMSLNKKQKIKMQDIENSLEQVSRDIDMMTYPDQEGIETDQKSQMASQHENKARANNLISDFLFTNTNYFELQNQRSSINQCQTTEMIGNFNHQQAGMIDRQEQDGLQFQSQMGTIGNLNQTSNFNQGNWFGARKQSNLNFDQINRSSRTINETHERGDDQMEIS